MTFKPLYALHKDADDKILDAGAFDYSFKLRDWVGSLDVQPGDRIEFGEKIERKEPIDMSNVEPLAIAPEGSKPAKVSA